MYARIAKQMLMYVTFVRRNLKFMIQKLKNPIVFRIQWSLLNAVFLHAINFIIGNVFKNLQKHSLLIRMIRVNLNVLFIFAVFA